MPTIGGGAGSGPSAACSARLPAPVRRLSHDELAHTLADLFPGLDVGKPTLVPDADMLGFTNRAKLLNASALLVQQYNDLAAGIAAKAVAKLDAVLPCAPTAAGCAEEFVAGFGQRALRRPLTNEERAAFLSHFEAAAAAGGGFAAGARATIQAILLDPDFHYRIERGEPGGDGLTPYEVASRLSYLLWGSMPDDRLFAAAEARGLDTPEAREAEARRMLADPRAGRMFVSFHRQWLEFDREIGERDPKLYPEAGPELKASIDEEVERFVRSVMVEGDGSVGALFQSRTAFVDARMAALYGLPAPASGWARVELPAGQRAGVLTRANFLASHGHYTNGNPPVRGANIMLRVLCRSLPPPPPDADLSTPTAKPGDAPKTNRQLFEERTRADAVCQGCHGIIDSFGFGFEKYDALGRYKEADNGLPVDARSELAGIDVAGPYDGAVELSEKLAASADVRACVARHWYEFATGRDKEEVDECRFGELRRVLDASGGDLRELLVAWVRSDDFVARPPVAP